MSDDDLQEDEQQPNWRRDLEDRVKQAESRATSAERKAALMEAGVDITSPTGKLFAKAYDGDADVEAIRKQAEEYGVLKPSSDEQPVSAAELKAMSDTAAASVGASAPASGDVETRFRQAMEAAQSQEEVEKIVAEFQGETNIALS
jgi:hypothetical protein